MKPSIPKGTRDFTPIQVLKRNFIFDTIKKVFIKYGYMPIETPTMENLSTLTGKYGEEGDRLLFKVLNSGDYLKKSNKEALGELNSNKLTSSISKKGLRYDLTVPFARYVVMHQNEISFPFKRYQIQPVWRADRPQKGRYQEFYQCDADIVGSRSLMSEAELIQIYDEVFANLGLNVTIKVNNRKILEGMAEIAGISDKMVAMTTIIDKLDKIGIEKVKEELLKCEISEKAAQIIIESLQIKTLSKLGEVLKDSEIGKKGIEELKQVHEYLDLKPTTNKVEFDITLARGLNYYTGCILEVVSNDVEMGSVGGGGRYDNLTEIFGLKDVSGVGISFGAARIFDVMTELDNFPKDLEGLLTVLLISESKSDHIEAFKLLNQLRAADISCDLYTEPAKYKRMIKYAINRKVPFVINVENGEYVLKDMVNSGQEKLNLETLIRKLGK